MLPFTTYLGFDIGQHGSWNPQQEKPEAWGCTLGQEIGLEEWHTSCHMERSPDEE